MRSKSRADRRAEPLGVILGRQGGVTLPASAPVSPVSDRDWESAVGTRIAARARPLRLDRGTLLVCAASSTWANELDLLAPTILERLGRRGLRVTRLRFVVGRVEAPERLGSRAEVPKCPAEAPLPDALRSELARVADEALRSAIAKAAAQNLGWQEATSAPPDARAPRPAGSKTARPARTSPKAPAGRRGSP